MDTQACWTDQALFPQLMELKWSVPEYKDILIPRLGGLHTSMNFLKVLYQHTHDSGLAHVWTESGILGPNTLDHAMSGKDYAKAIRTHKITLQAMWQLLLPQFLDYLDVHDKDLKEYLLDNSQSDDINDYDELVAILTSIRCREQMESFVLSNTEVNSNFQYWWQYMDMVCVLLLFIMAQRDGIWDLHLYAFGKCSHSFIAMITPIMLGGVRYTLQK